MKELSAFIDESGDFGELKERPAYYLVTFVFHNQDNSIEEQASKLEESVHNLGFDVEYIHTGSVIRRMEGKEVDVSVDNLEDIIVKYRPICIAKDGIELVDDVGGVGGFCRMLQTMYECNMDDVEELEEKDSM